MKTKTSIYRRHFAFAYVLLVAVIFCGCEVTNNNKEPLNYVKQVERGQLQVLEIDSCQYVVWDWIDVGGIVHKANCKYCVERSKK